jgi:polygalacturonase
MAKFWSLLYTLFFIIYVSHTSHATIVYNVINFGAKPDGIKDSTPAFLNAWSAACASSDSSTINVPKGRYLLGSLAFKGDCKSSDITFRIDGTLVAPADYRVLGKASNWLSFEGVSGVNIIGGALDAKGSALWACKAARMINCPNGATVLHRSLLNINTIFFIIVFVIVDMIYHD